MEYTPAQISGLSPIPDPDDLTSLDLTQIQNLIKERMEAFDKFEEGVQFHRLEQKRLKKQILDLQRAGKRLLLIKPRKVELPESIP